jgi:signal transduction histidine kinase
MRNFPFRTWIALWSTLLAALVLVVSGVCAAFFVQHRARVQLQEEMEFEAEHFLSELQQHGGAAFDWARIGAVVREWLPPESSPRLIEVRTNEGQLRFRTRDLKEPGFGLPPSGVHDIAVAGQTFMVIAKTRDGVTFLIGTSLEETRELLASLVQALAWALPVALVIAWLGGRWLAARAVQPVEKITAAAEQITAAQLNHRVPVPPVADEMQRLAIVLNSTLNRLERSYTQASRFSADASHELKTPVTVLRASIEALLESPFLEAADRVATAGLLEQTHRLSSIISSLLLLARADTNQLVLDTAPHDLTELISACVEDARILAAERSVTVSCELPPSPACARVDRIRFSQILSNLLDNAVKYNQRDGRIRLTLSSHGPVWELRVANTGPGIAPQDRPRIFERFFRAEHTTEQNGQGLGLSLVRELTLAHGGEIVLADSAKGWTEFLLTLPKAPEPASATSPPLDCPPTEQLHSTMKTSASLLAMLCFSLCFSTAAVAGELPKVKGIDRIPPAAAEGLVKYAADHSMKIEKVSTEKHGKVTVYEAELTAPGKPNHEVSVTSDGKVKGEEETVPLESVPEAVRQAITDGAKGAKISRVQKIQEDGELTYEALYVTDKGKKTEVLYRENGQVKPE